MEFIKTHITANIVISIVVILAAFIILYLCTVVFKKIMKNATMVNSRPVQTSIIGLGRVLRVIYIVLVVFLVFEINGIEVTSFLAGLGIAGAVAALAAQDIMKDLLNGFNVIGQHMYSVGDVIKYNDIEATVLDFNLRVTKAQLIESESIIFIPNRNISDIIVVSDFNMLDIPVPYEANPDKINEIMKLSETEMSKLDRMDNVVFKGLQDFGSSAIIYRFFFFCKPSVRGDMARASRSIIYKHLRDAGINIPYEQIDINIKKD